MFKNKKIIYVANVRMPTEKAHGVQIMHMCEAFSDQGIEVELVVPKRRNHIQGDVFTHFSIEEKFRITYIPVLDVVEWGRIGFWIEAFTFAIGTTMHVLKQKPDIVYGRDPFTFGILMFVHATVVWEVHNALNTLPLRLFGKYIAKFIVITKGVKEFLIHKGVSENKILVEHDAVVIEKFDIEIEQHEAREKVGLPHDAKIVVYTGHLYEQKNPYILADSIIALGDAYGVFVGGTEKDVAALKKRYEHEKRIIVVGQKPHSEIPYYIRSADIAVIPSSGKHAITRLYNSPMKLFEYMASAVAIVATDLPSHREVLRDGENAVLVEPDSASALTQGFTRIFSDDAFAQQLRRTARKDVENYTWSKRAKSILEYIV